MARKTFITIHLLRCKECGTKAEWPGNGWAFLSFKCAGKDQPNAVGPGLHDWEKIGERKKLVD